MIKNGSSVNDPAMNLNQFTLLDKNKSGTPRNGKIKNAQYIRREIQVTTPSIEKRKE